MIVYLVCFRINPRELLLPPIPGLIPIPGQKYVCSEPSLAVVFSRDYA